MRFLSKKRVLAFTALATLVFLAAAGTLFVYVNSPAFERDAQRYITQEIELRTGAKVTLGGFHWNLNARRIVLDDLVLRGREKDTDPPLLRVSQVQIGLNLRSIFQRKLNLFELIVSKPQFRVVAGADGRTNIPEPVALNPAKPLDFELSIEHFRVLQGTGFLLDRQVSVDFSFSNLSTELSYLGATGILSGNVKYEGDLAVPSHPNLPYSLDADVDYTRGTLLARHVQLRTGRSQLQLQGRVNSLLSKDLTGVLEYSGPMDTALLNDFVDRARVSGIVTVAGRMEFSRSDFSTAGNTTGDGIDFNNWSVAQLSSRYSYRYPAREAAFQNFVAEIGGGRAKGNISVTDLPGDPKTRLDVEFSQVDGSKFYRDYPWDAKYRIYSRLSGILKGSFEGAMEKYRFSGNANLDGYPAATLPGVVALPLTGSSGFEISDGHARLIHADVRLRETRVVAEGLIHPSASDLQVSLESSDLSEVSFIYGDANGSGTFQGTLKGPISKPLLDGSFTLQKHMYEKKWAADQVSGAVRFDSSTLAADLRRVRITQGKSEIQVDGRLVLGGSPIDLRIRAVRVLGSDLEPYFATKISGSLTGNLHLVSLNPFSIDGDIRAEQLHVNGRDVGTASGHIRYLEPVLTVDSGALSRNGSTISGSVIFNQLTEALKFSARLSNLDFAEVEGLDLPKGLTGKVTQADIQGDGSLKEPNVRGTAMIRDLSFKGEEFPVVQVVVTSDGPNVSADVEAARNLRVVARVNTADPDLPIRATATFTQYSIERLAGFAKGKVKATGTTSLAGRLRDPSSLQGQGRIEKLEAIVQERTLRTVKAFDFRFDEERLTLSQVILTGELTEISLAGTVGIGDQSPLDLAIRGSVDLALLSGAQPDVITSGSLIVDGQVRGTSKDPDLRGIAHLTNASIAKKGFFTTLSGLNGDLFFDVNRITLNEIEGRVGGGTIRLQGNALLRETQVQSMNVRIDTSEVRLRYPEGLRTVVSGSLILRGSPQDPVLDGDLEVQSMSYRNSFDEFLAAFKTAGVEDQSSVFGALRLNVHIEGSRNITVQNQLANLAARVDLDIRGTAERPALTGHVETNGGTLAFQGKRYAVTRGNVDFVDPLRIEPVVDIQAEAELRDYRVILSINGRSDRLRLSMSSDPPLSQIEIVNLVAGGKTRDELVAAGSNAAPSTEQLFQGRAYSILTDLLQERIGDKFGISNLARVRVDPFVVGSQNERTAWLTVERQLTKDLTVTYSQDLSSNRQKIVQIEYFVAGNTSVVATRDETDNLSLDVKFRKRLK